MTIDLFPSLGSPTIKSILMSTHMCVGIGSDCSAPSVFTVSPLCLWHVSHVATKSWMSFFIPSQKNECLVCSYVLWNLDWPTIGDECISSNTICFKVELFTRIMFPLYRNVLSYHVYPLGVLGSSWSFWMSWWVVSFVTHSVRESSN